PCANAWPANWTRCLPGYSTRPAAPASGNGSNWRTSCSALARNLLGWPRPAPSPCPLPQGWGRGQGEGAGRGRPNRRPVPVIPRRLIPLIFIPLVLILVGTVGYHVLEGWSFFNASYFTVVTLTTVGYGDLVPASRAGKAFTMALALCGIFTLFFA